MSSKLTPVFNKHFIEFLDDVSIIFPDNVDIQAAKNGVIATKKVNPALIIKIWHQHIATPYLEQIMAGDVEFFINKDYSKDVLNIGPGGAKVFFNHRDFSIISSCLMISLLFSSSSCISLLSL